MHTVFYPWQLGKHLQLPVPQITRNIKDKAGNIVLKAKAIRSRINDSKQEISFATSKCLKNIISSLERNLNSNPPKYIPLVILVIFITNAIFFFSKTWTALSNITNYYCFSSHLIPQELPTQWEISVDFQVPSSNSHAYSLMLQNFVTDIIFKTHIPEITHTHTHTHTYIYIYGPIFLILKHFSI